MGHGPPPSGLLGIFPMPTLLLPHCCFNMVGGRLPAHSRDPPHSLSLSPWGKVLPPDLTTLTSQRTASPLARLCREEGGVWLCAHPRLRSPADGHRCLCACRDRASPATGCLAPGAWLPGSCVLVLEPRGLCPVLLGVSLCSELAPDSIGTGASSEPAP